MYLTIDFKPEKTEELEKYIKAVLPEAINEAIFKDINRLNAIITECVRGYIKGTITELMQGKDFRNFLRDRIMEQIGMKDETLRSKDCNVENQ